MLGDSSLFEVEGAAVSLLASNNNHSTRDELGGASKAINGKMEHQKDNFHALLRPCASWTFSQASLEGEMPIPPKSSSSEGQVFLDEANKLLLFYSDSVLTVKQLADNQQDTYQLELPHGERIIWAEVSVDLKYLLVHAMSCPQLIKVYSLEAGQAQERFIVQGGKRGGSISRAHWTELGNLFLVSSTGIEFYQIPNRESLSLMEKWTLGQKEMRLLKEFRMAVTFSVYYASTRVLLAHTGLKGGKARLEGFFFKQDLAVKLPRLDIDLAGGSVLTADNIALCRLYERLYCAHIEEKQVTLYQITKTTITKKAAILLEGQPLPHRLRLHSVDNLLAVHNTDAKVTTLYDIRHTPTAPDDGHPVPPIANSLSLAPFDDDVDALSLYQERWQYHAPHYVLDPEARTLFEVSLDLPSLIGAFTDKERLVRFLLRRTQSRMLTLDVVREAIQQSLPLSVVANIFDAMNSVAADVVTPQTADKSVAGRSSAANGGGTPITRTTTISPAGKVLPPVSVIPSNLAAASSSLSMASSPGSSSPISFRSETLSSSIFSSSPLAPDSPSAIWMSPMPSTSTALSSSSSGLLFTSSPYASPSLPMSSLSSSLASLSSVAASQSPFPLAETTLAAAAAQPFAAWDIRIEEEKRGRANQLLLDQDDLYHHVFVPIDDGKEVGSKYFVAVLTEYVRSLSFYKQAVEHYIHKLIIEHLVTANRFFQLHQFLQYHVIGDSIHVACQLLSLEKQYPPAYQLALDMLKRLSGRKGVKDQIVEVLLTRGQLLPALRFIRNTDVTVQSERFLEVALERDESLFYTTYKFFEQRGEINRACAPYIKAFGSLFPVDETGRSDSTSSGGSGSDDSAPASAMSSLGSLADLSSTSSPYASPLATPKKLKTTTTSKPSAVAS